MTSMDQALKANVEAFMACCVLLEIEPGLVGTSRHTDNFYVLFCTSHVEAVLLENFIHWNDYLLYQICLCLEIFVSYLIFQVVIGFIALKCSHSLVLDEAVEVITPKWHFLDALYVFLVLSF